MKLPNTESSAEQPEAKPGFLARHPFLAMISVGLALAVLFFRSAEDLEKLPPERRGVPEEIPPLAKPAESERLAPGEARANPGPWGGVRRTRLYLEPRHPAELGPEHQTAAPEWRLPGVDRAGLEALLARPSFNAKDREWILGALAGEQPEGGLRLRPKPAAVLGLSANGRAEWYGILAQWPENPAQRRPWIFPTNEVAAMFSQSGLGAETLIFLDSLLYKHGDALAFADLGLAAATLTNQVEIQGLVQTLGRKPVEFLKLFVPNGMEVGPLLGYWLKEPDGGRLETLLRAMARQPEGATVDVVHLLPTFARERLYTTPSEADGPLAARRGAVWGALNFFNPTPDDRFCDLGEAVAALREHYLPVVDDPAFGDVALFRDAQGNWVHAGVYIADDVLFTRLGTGPEEAWTLLGFEDLMASHSWERLKVSALRLKRHTRPLPTPALTPNPAVAPGA